MRRRLFLLLAASALLVTATQAQQGGIERRFFPAPDVTFNTPAFTGGDEDYPRIISFLEGLVRKAPGRATLNYIGETQGGLAIPAVRIAGSGAGPKVKVLFSGGIHGDEPCGTEGLLVLLDSLLSDPGGESRLTNIDLEVVPVVNIDGYLRGNRVSKNKLDVNRDFTKLETPEARALYRAYAAFGPDVFIDFHEYNPYRADFAKMQEQGVTSYFDALLLYSGNLNIDAGLRAGCTTYLVDPVKAALAAAGLHAFEYFKPELQRGHRVFILGSNSPRSTSTTFALNNSISMLLEIRGVGLEKYSLKRRTRTAYLVADAALRSAGPGRDAILSLVKAARETAAGGSGEAVVKTTKKRQLARLPFIDINKAEKVDIEGDVSNNLIQTKAVGREKPKGYLITANTDGVKGLLEAMGIRYSVVAAPARVAVERYQITGEEEGDGDVEGVSEQVVTVSLMPDEIAITPGTLFIPTNQPQGNLLTELVEPDAGNSWYHFSVLRPGPDGRIPIYRYFKSYAL